MKKMTVRLSDAAAMMALACGSALADSDPRECSNATLEGSYVFSASGFTVPQAGTWAGTWVPKAIIEYIRSDGHGNLTVPSATVANRFGNGQVEVTATPDSPPGPGSGTYTLGEDCTGTLSFHPQPGPKFNIIASPKGDEVWMIQTNPNNVLQGNLKRVVKD